MTIFNEDTHTYTVDGVVLPSVTHICRFFMVDVAAGARTWLRDVAADRGSRVHAYTVAADYGETPEVIDPDCAGYVKAYERFLRDYTPQWQYIEHVMGSRELGYAGTADRIGIIDGKRVILDIKTTSKLHKIAVTAQLQGYCKLAFEQDGFAAEKLCALLLDKGGTYRIYDLPFGGEFTLALRMEQTLKGERK